MWPPPMIATTSGTSTRRSRHTAHCASSLGSAMGADDDACAAAGSANFFLPRRFLDFLGLGGGGDAGAHWCGDDGGASSGSGVSSGNGCGCGAPSQKREYI